MPFFINIARSKGSRNVFFSFLARGFYQIFIFQYLVIKQITITYHNLPNYQKSYCLQIWAIFSVRRSPCGRNFKGLIWGWQWALSETAKNNLKQVKNAIKSYTMPFKELQSQKQDTEREKWIVGKPEKLFI